MLTTDERNAETSRRECKAFCDVPPMRYFLYVNMKKRIVTTWTGEKLGDLLLAHSATHRSNMGDERQYIQVLGINGVKYWGWFYGLWASMGRSLFCSYGPV